MTVVVPCQPFYHCSGPMPTTLCCTRDAYLYCTMVLTSLLVFSSLFLLGWSGGGFAWSAQRPCVLVGAGNVPLSAHLVVLMQYAPQNDPHHSQTSFIFNGDFVDRAMAGVQVHSKMSDSQSTGMPTHWAEPHIGAHNSLCIEAAVSS